MDDSGSDVIATLGASAPRRIFASGVMGILGVLLVYLATMSTATLVGTLILAAAGFGVMWMAWWQWQVTEEVIELTATELRTSGGVVLARVGDVTGVDRGALAFKPSQGFVVRTTRAQPRAWAPGLYWRVGRTLGVGGVTGAGQGKFMAETLTAMIGQTD
ncbi:MAG: hypothetical protein AAF714_11055 [Pseudomonadota bacterium]